MAIVKVRDKTSRIRGGEALAPRFFDFTANFFSGILVYVNASRDVPAERLYKREYFVVFVTILGRF